MIFIRKPPWRKALFSTHAIVIFNGASCLACVCPTVIDYLDE